MSLEKHLAVGQISAVSCTESSDDDRLFKFKNRYLTYAVRSRPTSKALVIIFSGVDATSSFCRMSYYGLREELNANVIHIMDNFGAHGCYLLSIAGDQQIRNAVISLIRSLQSEMGVGNNDTYLVGTSKGATTAIAYALMIGGGTVIAGEPQINLGDFIYNLKWHNLEQWRSLAYTMLGRVNEDDRHLLNGYISDIGKKYASRFSGKMIIHHGKTGYFENHIVHFRDLLVSLGVGEKLVCIEHEFREHNDIVPVFTESLKTLFQIDSSK